MQSSFAVLFSDAKVKQSKTAAVHINARFSAEDLAGMLEWRTNTQGVMHS